MANLCSLLIHTSFIGRTYHDFRLNFQSLPENCSFDPLLIEFTRLINSTFNQTSYTLYDSTQSNHYSPTLQIFPNDHINLCIQSALDTDQIDRTCHEFYMITMLSSINSNIWPLLIIFAYLLILLMGILASSLSKLYRQFSRTIFSGSVTKKMLKNQAQSPYLTRLGQKSRSAEKREVLRAIQLIAQDCQSSRKTETFIIPTDNKKGHINRAYI